VPCPRKYVQAVILASSAAQQDQAYALTADLDSILTVMVQWFALPVLLEPLLLVIAARATRIAPNAMLELMLQGDHRAVLYVMLDGMLKHLDQAPVFLVQLVSFRVFPDQYLICVEYALDQPSLCLEQAHASAVMLDFTSPQKAQVRTRIAGNALQASTCQLAACSAPTVQQGSSLCLAHFNVAIHVKQVLIRVMA
jgi:hypothetical protein